VRSQSITNPLSPACRSRHRGHVPMIFCSDSAQYGNRAALVFCRHSLPSTRKSKRETALAVAAQLVSSDRRSNPMNSLLDRSRCQLTAGVRERRQILEVFQIRHRDSLAE